MQAELQGFWDWIPPRTQRRGSMQEMHHLASWWTPYSSSATLLDSLRFPFSFEECFAANSLRWTESCSSILLLACLFVFTMGSLFNRTIILTWIHRGLLVIFPPCWSTQTRSVSILSCGCLSALSLLILVVGWVFPRAVFGQRLVI